MDNIKVISISDLDDNGWQDYFNLTVEIYRKFPSGEIYNDGSWQNFKARILKTCEIYQDRSYKEYLVSFNEKPAAWLALRLVIRGSSVEFNTIYEEVPGEIMKAILSKLYDYMYRENVENSYYRSFDGHCISALKETGAEVTEELITTKLERENMDPVFYREIINNTDISGYKLDLFSSFPVEVVDEFTALMNDIFKGIDSLNPYGAVIGERTGSFWLRKYGNEKAGGSELKMSMLFDSDNSIAAYCSLFVDPDNPLTVRHGGGYTVVNRKYRGKGLAKYLKAIMYLKLLEENSDFTNIETDTMPWNKYMYRINEEFGFVPYEHGNEFRFTKDFLENYLENK